MATRLQAGPAAWTLAGFALAAAFAGSAATGCSDGKDGPREFAGPAADLEEEIRGSKAPFVGSAVPAGTEESGYVEHEWVASGEATLYVEAAPHAAGVRVRVRAVPGSARDDVLGRHGGSLRVAVRAVAERGRANEALYDLLAARTGIPRRNVEVVSGRLARDRVVLLRGLGPSEARSRIEGSVPGEGVAS